MNRSAKRLMWLLSAVAAVLAIAGCGAAEASRSDGRAVRPERTLKEDASLQGVLGGDPKSGCLWIQGRGQVQFILYGDYQVAFVDEQMVVQRDGTVVARGGEPVRLTGGLSPRADDPGVEGCPARDELFFADGIEPNDQP